MEKIQKSILTFAFSEPNGRIKGIVQNNHHISMVPAQLCNPVPQQEGLAGGQDHVLPPAGLLPRVWRWVPCRLSSSAKDKDVIKSNIEKYFTTYPILHYMANDRYVWAICIGELTEISQDHNVLLMPDAKDKHILIELNTWLSNYHLVDGQQELIRQRKTSVGCRSEAGPCGSSAVYPEGIPCKQSRPRSASVQPLHLCNRSAVAR